MSKPKTKKKRGHPRGSLMQKMAIQYRLENGGTMADAMRAVGYSESMAKNPQKINASQAFAEELERVGLTDRYLAKGYKDFTKASELREYVFYHRQIEETIELDEDDPEYKKGKNNVKIIKSYKKVSDKHIEGVISRIAGAELISIQDHYDRRVAFYQKPDFTARKTGFELASKVKKHFVEENPFAPVAYVMTAEEKEKYDRIIGKNKK